MAVWFAKPMPRDEFGNSCSNVRIFSKANTIAWYFSYTAPISARVCEFGEAEEKQNPGISDGQSPLFCRARLARQIIDDNREEKRND
jgi:hypothetical protein